MAALRNVGQTAVTLKSCQESVMDHSKDSHVCDLYIQSLSTSSPVYVIVK